ncbi:MAG: hypothetical protein AAF571_05750 [Verrucomicrobiota bacterium]
MKRIALFSGLLALILVVLLTVAAVVLIPHRFLSSEGFRQEMNRQTNLALKGQGEWMPFRLDGWTLRSDGYDGTGSFSSYTYRVRAEHVSFKINWRALLQRTWQIDPIVVQTLAIEVTPLAESAPADPPTPSDEAPDIPKIARLFIPQNVDIKAIELSDASLVWQAADQQTYRLSDIRAKSIPDGYGAWSTSVSSGVLTPPNRFSWSLNSARLVGDLQQMQLDHAEWLGKEAGVVKLSGPLTRDGNLQAKLNIEGRGIPAHYFTATEWKEFIEGSIDSDATAQITAEGVTLEGEATGNSIRLVGVPVLRSMSDATGLREWTELSLDTAWLQFKYQPDHLEIPSSVFESKDLLRLEGNLQIRAEALSGLYQVGLAPRVVSRIPGAQITVFKLEQNGYYWAQPPMTLSGTADNPQEDLSPRMKTAIFDAVQEKLNQGVNKGLNILDSILQQVP